MGVVLAVNLLELRVHVEECTHGVGGGEFLGGERLGRIGREGREGGVVADAFQEANREPSSEQRWLRVGQAFGGLVLAVE